MSQIEIEKYLSDGKERCVEEISKACNVNLATVYKSLKKMIKYGEVKVSKKPKKIRGRETMCIRMVSVFFVPR